jgi:hypothetical protein
MNITAVFYVPSSVLAQAFTVFLLCLQHVTTQESIHEDSLLDWLKR